MLVDRDLVALAYAEANARRNGLENVELLGSNKHDDSRELMLGGAGLRSLSSASRNSRIRG